MNDQLVTWVQTWGYWIVFLGSLVEGESILLTAAALAAAGYLSIYLVAIISFCGTVVADQGLFMLGHYYGKSAISKLTQIFPSTSPHIERAKQWLHRHQTFYILIFRFIYGVRTISPLVMGAQDIPFRRFAILNLVSAAIWSVGSCAMGYFFGGMIHALFKRVGVVVFVVIIACLVGGLVWKWKRKRARLEAHDSRENP